jgi:hypothetical protein
MYLGAEHLMGFLTVRPSAQWYSYFGPADIIGQLSSVQNSVIVPYSLFIWLKKSTAGTKKYSDCREQESETDCSCHPLMQTALYYKSGLFQVNVSSVAAVCTLLRK